MKTIGLIGGLSWESTLIYYKMINEYIAKRLGKLNSAKLLLNSLNFQELIDYKNQDNWEAITKILIDSARVVENAGASFIALCCNALHKVAINIEKNISIPFLHIIDASAHSLMQQNITNVGLLGTKFTMEDGFYGNYLLNKYNIKVTIPSQKMMTKIDDIIFQELCNGKSLTKSKNLLSDVIQTMHNSGVKGILLSCTELGMLVKEKDFSLPIFDTTILHANFIANYCINNYIIH